MQITLKNGQAISYQLLSSETVSTHLISVNVGLSDVDILVTVRNGENAAEVIASSVEQLIRQSYPKINQACAAIEEQEAYEAKLAVEGEKLARQYLDDGLIMVNFVDGKPHIHSTFVGGLQFDAIRGDRTFGTLPEAQDFVDERNTQHILLT